VNRLYSISPGRYGVIVWSNSPSVKLTASWGALGAAEGRLDPIAGSAAGIAELPAETASAGVPLWAYSFCERMIFGMRPGLRDRRHHPLATIKLESHKRQEGHRASRARKPQNRPIQVTSALTGFRKPVFGANGPGGLSGAYTAMEVLGRVRIVLVYSPGS
jgi:hypothetical protein